MRVISPKATRLFAVRHPAARNPLSDWLKVAKRADWGSFADLRAEFGPKVDRYRRLFIFDIGGNKYRLIAAIHFNRGVVYIRHVLTHAEYDRGAWKED
jgi:mRNA interferase HigB